MPPNPLSQLNRPGNPLRQLDLHQQQANLSLVFSHPTPVGQQAHPTLDHPYPSTSHSEYTNLNPNQLSGALGQYGDLAHLDGLDQDPQTKYSPATALEYPGESPRNSVCDRPDPDINSSSYPNSAQFQAQLNAAVLPEANQLVNSLLGHSSQGGHPSYPLISPQNSSTQPSDCPRHLHPSSEAKLTHPSDQSVQHRDIGAEAVDLSHETLPSTSSLVENSAPDGQKTDRCKRKITDKRREQNRANQKAFRERRDLSSKQKDREIHELEEVLKRHETVEREQRETIKILQARLASVECLQSSENPSSSPDSSRGYLDGNSLPSNNQNLPLVENLQLGKNRQFPFTIQTANCQTQNGSLQWLPSGSTFRPIFDSNQSGGSYQDF